MTDDGRRRDRPSSSEEEGDSWTSDVSFNNEGMSISDILGAGGSLRTVGTALGGMVAPGLEEKLKLVDKGLTATFRLVSEAYERDAERTQEILGSDDSAMDKLAGLNNIVLDEGEGD